LIKNPITCISAYAQLLRRHITRGGRLDIRQMAQRLERLETISARLAETIDEVLAVAHGQTGPSLELHRGPVDLVALVRQIVAEYDLAQEQVRFHVQTMVPGLTG